MYISQPLSAYSPFVLLTLALLLLWLRHNKQAFMRGMWSFALLAATVLGLALGQLTPIAVLAMAMIATLAWAANRLQAWLWPVVPTNRAY